MKIRDLNIENSYANKSIIFSENMLGLYLTKDLREFISENVIPHNRFARKWHIFRDSFGLAGQVDFIGDLSEEGFGLTNAPAFILNKV